MYDILTFIIYKSHDLFRTNRERKPTQSSVSIPDSDNSCKFNDTYGGNVF